MPDIDLIEEITGYVLRGAPKFMVQMAVEDNDHDALQYMVSTHYSRGYGLTYAQLEELRDNLMFRF